MGQVIRNFPDDHTHNEPPVLNDTTATFANLATRTTGLWPGATVYVQDENKEYRFNGLYWTPKILSDTLQLDGGSGDEGVFTWNDDEHTVDLIQNGTILQLGQENQFPLIENQTGSQIDDGTPVMYAGTIGASGKMLITPMDGTDPDNAVLYMGFATENIAHEGTGKISWFGKVRGIQTDGVNYGEVWNDGDILYISTTSVGELTNVQPATGLNLPIALVIDKHSSNGTLLVRSSNLDLNLYATVADISITDDYVAVGTGTGVEGTINFRWDESQRTLYTIGYDGNILQAWEQNATPIALIMTYDYYGDEFGLMDNDDQVIAARSIGTSDKYYYAGQQVTWDQGDFKIDGNSTSWYYNFNDDSFFLGLEDEAQIDGSTGIINVKGSSRVSLGDTEGVGNEVYLDIDATNETFNFFNAPLEVVLANYETYVTTDDIIPNKKYVDDEIDDLTGGDAITRTGDVFKLGGDWGAAPIFLTTTKAGGNSFYMQSQNSTTSRQGLFQLNTINGYGSFHMENSNDVYGLTLQDLSTGGGGDEDQIATLFYRSVNDSSALKIKPDGMVIMDEVNEIGLVYEEDYSTQGIAHGDRWIPDIGAVDDTIQGYISAGVSTKDNLSIAGQRNFLDTVYFQKEVYFEDTVYFNSEVRFSNTVWTDLVISATNAKQGALSLPAFDYDTVATNFVDDDSTQVLYINYQMPHGYKAGTYVDFHVHWNQYSASDSVNFHGEYRKLPLGSAGDNEWTYFEITWGELIPYVSGITNQIAEFPPIDMTGMGESSILQIKLWHDEDPGTDYSDDIFVTSFDLHYQLDKLGSNEEDPTQ